MSRARISLAKSSDAGPLGGSAMRPGLVKQTPPAPALIALARLLARQAAREARVCDIDAS